MSNEQQFIITVRFSGNHGAYGMKFIFTMPVIPYPDWNDTDERWLTYDEHKIVKQSFIEEFEKSRNIKFDGEVLFIEPSSLSTVMHSALKKLN